MKFYFTAILCVAFLMKSYSQKKLDTYTSPYDSKEYLIQITDDPEDYELYIQLASVDSYEGGIFLSKDQVSKFRVSLIEAQAKYREWSQVAEENDVKELRKEMLMKSKCGAYFKISDYHFDYNVELTYYFIVYHDEETNSTLYGLMATTGELNASGNDYVDAEGFVLAFDSYDKITEFLDKFSRSRIDKFHKEISSKEDLFKH